jgi:hypothetical protein
MAKTRTDWTRNNSKSYKMLGSYRHQRKVAIQRVNDRNTSFSWKMKMKVRVQQDPSEDATYGGPAREYVESRVALDDAPMDKKPLQQPEQPLDLGWKLPTAEKRTKKKPTLDADNDDLSSHPPADRKEEAAQHRTRLLRELSARLARDTQLRYAEREFEMQRLLMGKGRRRKLRGVEKVEGDKDEAEDEDELDARKGRPRKGKPKVVDEATWKPRVYKWKVERKK